MNERIESDEIQANGGLSHAYQTARVIIKEGNEEVGSKLGIEIRLIPISKNDEEAKKFKPRSFFINKNEIHKWDKLIFEMIKFRWYFIKKEKIFDLDFIEELKGYYMKRVRESIEEGLKNGGINNANSF